MLDLLLIRPCVNYQKHQEYTKALKVDPTIVRQVSPPLGVAYIIAEIKHRGMAAGFIDMEIEDIKIDDLLERIAVESPRVIGFSAVTVQADAANFLAGKIRQNFSMPLVIGGAHTTGMPNTSFPDFDLVWRGEFSSLEDQPFPDWSAFDLEKYDGADPHRTKRELPISTSRGCPFKCVFCVRPFGQKRRSRTVESIIAEIKRDIDDFGAESLIFCDETLTANLKFSSALFQRMLDEELLIKWSGETRIDTATPEIYQLMKAAGCYYLYFGLESGNDRILKLAGKNFTVAQIKQSVKWAKEAGLICAGSFILGLPGETEVSVWQSIELAHELDIYSVTFPIAVPFPGTEIRRMAERGDYGLRILSNKWSDYGKQEPGVMDSVNLPIEKLRELQQKAYEYNPKKKL